MAYYRVCPDCGSNLDPGEICDCKIQRMKQPEEAAAEWERKGGERHERRIAAAGRAVSRYADRAVRVG